MSKFGKKFASTVLALLMTGSLMPVSAMADDTTATAEPESTGEATDNSAETDTSSESAETVEAPADSSAEASADSNAEAPAESDAETPAADANTDAGTADQTADNQNTTSAVKAVHLTINGYGTLEIAGSKYSSEDSGKFDDTIKIDTSDTSFFEFTIKADDGYTLSSYTGNSGDGNPADVYIRTAYDKDNKEIANTYTGYISLHTDSTDLEVNLNKAKFRKAVRRAAAVSAEDAVFNADWASIASYAESKWTGMIYGQPYDCSALVSHAFIENGVNVSGNTGYWTNVLNNLVSQGRCTYTDTSITGSWQTGGSVTNGMAQKGDIVIFYTDDARTAGNSTHMGFMMGGTNYFSALYDGTRTMDINRYTVAGAKTGLKLRIYHKVTNKEVYADIQKKSALTSITDNNAKYADLTTTFEIYDKKGGTKLATVTTNSHGEASVGPFSVSAGTTSLYVKEITAPANYELDSVNKNGKTVAIGKDSHARFTGNNAFKDTPKNDPAKITITKKDADARTYAGDLSGAVFKLVYTDGASTTRTWYIQTKKETVKDKVGYLAKLGKDWLVNNDQYKSDDLYYDAGKKVVIPIGHLTVTEEAPANGYTKDGGYITSVWGSSAGDTVSSNDKMEYDIVDTASGVVVKAGNIAVSEDITKLEKSVRGSLTVEKQDTETGAAAQGDATFAGAEFDIKYVKDAAGKTDDSAAGIKLDTDGDGTGDSKEFKAGSVVYHFTVGDDGKWQPTKADGSFNDSFLPAGEYQLVETKAPTGYVNADKDGKSPVTVDFTISATPSDVTVNQTLNEIVGDKPVRGGFEFKKLDVQTGEKHQGNAKSLKGTFGVVLDSDKAVAVSGKQYNKGETVFTFDTNDDGYYKSTKDLLPYGTYHIYEITAPEGYEATAATTSLVIREDQKIVPASYDISTGKVTTTSEALADQIFRGGFTFNKLDSKWGTRTAGDNTNLAGTFKLVNRSAYAVDVDVNGDGKDESYGVGKTIYTFSTDKEGYYSSETDKGVRFLPVGTYEIVEVTSPAHYSAAKESTTFIIANDNEVKECRYTVENGRLNGDGRENTIVNDEYDGAIRITKIKAKSISSKASYEKGAKFDIVLARYVYSVNNKQPGDEITRDDVLRAYDARETAQVVDAKGDACTGFADNEFDELTTDSKGKATSKKLAYGTYFYAQRSSEDPESEIVDNYFTFVVNSENQPTEDEAPIINTPKLYTIKITKMDKDTGNKVTLDSASFKIKCLSLDNTQNDPTYTLDKLSKKEKLELGIGDDNYVTWVNENKQKYNVFRTYATKTANDKNLEKGVFYPVKEEDGKITGYVNEPAKVPAGTYQLFETDDPEYFKKGVFTNISEDGVFHVGVNSTYKEPSDDGTYTISLENYNNQLTGSLYLKKSLDGWKDAEKTVKTENGKYVEFNTEDLSQYGFKLTAADDILSPDDGSVIVKKGGDAKYLTHDSSNAYADIGIRYCNADGTLTITDIPVGHYTLTEAVQPSGTVKSDKKYDVVVTESKDNDDQAVVTVDGKTNSVDNKVKAELEVKNYITKFEITKTDVAGKEVEGAQIQIVDAETGEVVDSWVSTTKSHKIAGLTADHDYRLVETGAPGSYVKASDVAFHVDNNGDVQKVTMVDKLVKVTKKDVAGDEVTGAQMSVTDENGNVVDSWISDGSNHEVKGLEEGKNYVLHEVTAPNGYVKATDIPFTAEGADEKGKKSDQQLNMTDKFVDVSKVDVAGKEVKGALMSITDEAGNVIDQWTSGEQIVAFTKNQLKSLKEGKQITVTVQDTSTAVATAAKNENGDYVITVTTTLEDGRNAFAEVNEDGYEFEHRVSGLEEGKNYVLHEVAAPETYAKAVDIPFTAEGAYKNGNKSNQFIEMTDKKVLSVKADMCGTKVDGAQLTVYPVVDGNVDTGTVVDQWTTSKDADHYINNLSVGGTYVISETVVPAGYVKMADHTFTVKDDKKDQKESIVNKQVEISKETVGGKEIPGAKLTVTDKETGTVVDQWTSTSETHYASGLEVGRTYVLTEDTAPLGYVKQTQIEFTVKDDGVDQKVTMVDTVEELEKVDEDGNPVKGSEIQVINANGDVVETWTTGAHLIDLTEDEVKLMKGGKSITKTTADGKTVKIIVTDENAKTKDDSKTDDSGKDSEKEVKEACEVKNSGAKQASVLDDSEIKVTDDSKLKYTMVVDNGDGTYSYYNIDENGDEAAHRISNLVVGETYTVHEVKPADGYYFTADQTFVNDGKTDGKITMVDNRVKYEIDKVDNDGKQIEGVQLKLEDVTDEANVTEVELPNGGITTDEPFKLDGKLIAGHSYRITETETVEGFSMPQVATLDFKVPETGSVEWSIVKMVNYPNKIMVEKVDNHGNTVAGADMQLMSTVTDENGNVTADKVLYSWTTTDKPEDISKYVKGGTSEKYILRETEAPFGYEKITDMVFTVDIANGTAKVIMVTDNIEHVYITAEKVDQANNTKKLAGAELTLYTNDGKVAKDINGKDCVGVTDANGKVSWEVEYAKGMYVKETKAPKGYKLNKKFHEVKVNKNYTFTSDDVIKVTVSDESNTNVNTGVRNGIGIAVVVFAGAAAAAVYIHFRKKEEEAK